MGLCVSEDGSHHHSINRNDCEKIKDLGKGASSTVHLVRHKTTGILYAMKEIPKSTTRCGKAYDIAFNEKSILLKIIHPFIAKFFASFQTNNNVYFVIEYVHGGDMRNFLNQRGKLSEELARHFSSEILLALEYLHEENIIYRDIKPRNVLIDQNGHIRLIDFGLAKVTKDFAETMCGTPAYIAPEVFCGAEYTSKADWWGFVYF